MKIKFKAPDPRAGTIAQMDSRLGQHFIDTGSAVLVKEMDERPVTTRGELDQALATLPGENTDPDYVVRAMRSHFKELFTDADEAKVREVVKLHAGDAADVHEGGVSAAQDSTDQPVDPKPDGEAVSEPRAKKAPDPKKGA